MEWVPGQMQLVSASGDHTTSLWQLRESNFEHIRTFDGHTRSVKTVAFRRTDPTCFATGGRDNAILIWDTRAKPNLGKADNRITGGHANGPGTPHAYRKSTRQTPKLPPNTSSSSITGLAFQVSAKLNRAKNQFSFKTIFVLYAHRMITRWFHVAAVMA